MEKKMTLLLMAAGKGSRYGKLKQFDNLGPKDEFLMEFSIYDAIEAGFDHVVAITQKDHVDFLKDHLTSKLPKSISIDVLAQNLEDLPDGTKINVDRQKPWGTAHAVWTARNHINNSFVVLNSDDYYGKQAFKETAIFLKTNNSQTALVGYVLKETLSPNGSVSRGICQISNGNLVSIRERLKIVSHNGEITDKDSGMHFTGEEKVSMNFWVCRPSLFKEIETYLSTFIQDKELVQNSEVYLPLLIQHLITENKLSVTVLRSGGKWFGVTYAADREGAVSQLKHMTQHGIYPIPLWKKKEH